MMPTYNRSKALIQSKIFQNCFSCSIVGGLLRVSK